MISGQWLLTACGDLRIPHNLHFCHKDDALSLHGVCEHLERTVVSSGFCCFTISVLLTRYNLINLNVKAQ